MSATSRGESHRADAVELVLSASGIPFEHEESEAPRMLAQAQVHAILALVEEQRTANMLAHLARLDAAGIDNPAASALEDEVLTRLGLDL